MSWISVRCRYALVAFPLLIGLGTYGLTRASKFLDPVADAPRTVDLGCVDNLAQIDYDVPIKNNGRKDLVLKDFRGGCASCLQFGLKTSSGPADVDTLTLAPGKSVIIAAHLRVHGSPNKPFSTFIACDTNDPNLPKVEVVFNASIRGQIVPFPPTVDFGDLEPGQHACRQIDLRNTGRGEEFQFSRAECPPNIRAEFIGVGTGTGSVGALEVTASGPESNWAIDGNIFVYEVDRAQPSMIIPIRAAIPELAEVSPTAAILPRVVGAGKDYTVECRFRSPKGLSMTVHPENEPAELVFTPLGPLGGDGPGYRIEWRASAVPHEGTIRSVTVRFNVEAGGRKKIIEVPIRCRSVK